MRTLMLGVMVLVGLSARISAQEPVRGGFHMSAGVGAPLYPARMSDANAGLTLQLGVGFPVSGAILRVYLEAVDFPRNQVTIDSDGLGFSRAPMSNAAVSL